MALHAESGGSDEGRDRWDAWSQPGKEYAARNLRYKWDTFGDYKAEKRTIASIYHLAKTHGWNPATGNLREPSRLTLLSPTECRDAPARDYLVKGLTSAGDVGCLYGAPGAGKSLLASHIGYAIAQGRSVFGMRTRQGPVLYVAAEDARGMRSRIRALLIRHGDAPDFTLVDGVSDLLLPDSPDLAALHGVIADRQPAMIIIDTLAIAFPGLEENAADGMGRVVAVARSLAKSGAAVILVHHDTKAQTPTPRGHSLFNGALDMALQLFAADEQGIVRGRLTKNRNGPCDRDIAFRIATESFGVDDDGDCITAALVDEVAPGSAAKPERLSASERAALGHLMALRVGSAAGDEREFREACINGRGVSASDDRANRRKATDRAIAGLVRKGMIIIDGDHVAPVLGDDNDSIGFDDELDSLP
jgi:AAA domain/Primase C terminal 2 (PriCT-2)